LSIVKKITKIIKKGRKTLDFYFVFFYTAKVSNNAVAATADFFPQHLRGALALPV